MAVPWNVGVQLVDTVVWTPEIVAIYGGSTGDLHFGRETNEAGEVQAGTSEPKYQGGLESQIIYKFNILASCISQPSAAAGSPDEIGVHTISFPSGKWRRLGFV